MRWRRTFLEGTGRRERLDVIVVTLRICHAHMQSRALCSEGAPSEARGARVVTTRGVKRFESMKRARLSRSREPIVYITRMWPYTTECVGP